MMKSISLISLVILLFLQESAAQSNCFPNGITFSTQASIDNFAVANPGCTGITGPVTITGADITHLSGLSDVNFFGNSITIINNPALTSLTGLEYAEVFGNLTIKNNNLLPSLTGLTNIFISGACEISNNNALVSLEGFGTNVNFQGELYIQNNPALTTLTGLENFKSFGLTLEISGNINLEHLTGLNNVKMVGKGLNIVNNPKLLDLSGLDSLQTVVDLIINNNPLLVNLHGLEQLTSKAKNISIFQNNQLTSLSGLENLTGLERLWISKNPLLTSLSGLGAMDSISVSCNIIENSLLTSLEGLNDVKYVGNLNIDNNPKLLSLQGLNNLETSKDCTIKNNPKLNNLTALGQLVKTETLVITNNPVLASLAGLQQLEQIEISAQITSNPALPNLAALTQLKSSGSISITTNDNLVSLAGLENLEKCGGFTLTGNPKLADISALANLDTAGTIKITNNALLPGLSGLEQLKVINGNLTIQNQPLFTSLAGLSGLNKIAGSVTITLNSGLINLNGLAQLTRVGNALEIGNNTSLTSLSGLNNVVSVGGDFKLYTCGVLADISALSALDTIGKTFSIVNLNGLPSLTGLNNLKCVKTDFIISQLQALTGVQPLSNLHFVGGDFFLGGTNELISLAGLENLTHIGGRLSLQANYKLQTLSGLSGLSYVGDGLAVLQNYVLTSLAGLGNLPQLNGSLALEDNIALTYASIPAVCDLLTTLAFPVDITNNGPGCETVFDVELACGAKPVLISVVLDRDGDCLQGPDEKNMVNIPVKLLKPTGSITRPTGADGIAALGLLDTGNFQLALLQFPNDHWELCMDTISIDPDTFPDTIRVSFFLHPFNPCPDLSVHMGLPSVFRGCLVTSDMEVTVENIGIDTAQNVRVAVVLPLDVIDIVSTVPAVALQSGDTLFFAAGHLPAFEPTSINITFHTQCDTFLLGQTLCLEAFAHLDNPCPPNMPLFSEIRLFSECLSDTTVRFTLKNVGNAPTQAMHEYVIIEDEVILRRDFFTLDPQEQFTVEVDADGSTFRIEATKFEDGQLTAQAIENCGGLTPGFITAYWIDEGIKNYDFDCRRVVLAYDPNQKTAIPSGTGPDHLLAANRPIQYTIDFQNTGTDTAFRVLLRDILPPQLDISTFRPLFASHPYTWEIRGNDTLEVLFFPIALPDSAANQNLSHGFFTFDISQQPDLPDGTVIENTASIIFDFNPPIITNTMVHTIGELTVSADEVQTYPGLWKVHGNPLRSSATFQSNIEIAGLKKIIFADVSGRPILEDQFSGSTYVLQRNQLHAGMYFFAITDIKGRKFTGKVVVSE